MKIRVHPRCKSAFIRVVVGMVALVLLVSPFFVLVPQTHAQDFGLKETAKRSGLYVQDKTKTGTATEVQNVVGQLIGTLLSFVGILFLLLTIYGGILWMTAHGSEEQTGKAKKIIISAVVGLLIVFASYMITAFVTGQLSGAFGVGQ